MKLNKKGFTLIELMIVVVIIGILASIAIPQFLRYQLKSKTSEAPRNIGAIRTNEEAFSAKWGNYVSASNAPASVPGTAKAAFGGSLGFSTLGFAPAGNVFYSYAVGTTFTAAIGVDTTIDATGGLVNGIAQTANPDIFIAATGDLDGDGNNGIFYSSDERIEVLGYPTNTGESVF